MNDLEQNSDSSGSIIASACTDTDDKKQFERLGFGYILPVLLEAQG